jgi:chemotaxis protein MotC
MSWRARAASVLLSACLPIAAQAADGIAPYKMVRSLQIVQDQIANGDHASLPMQQKLLELTDARFRGASKEDFDDPRNLSALLVWAMSGGNPTTVEVALSRLELEGDDAVVGKGVLASSIRSTRWPAATTPAPSSHSSRDRLLAEKPQARPSG